MKVMRNSGDISAHKAGASILFPSMLRIVPDSQSADIKAERHWTSRCRLLAASCVASATRTAGLPRHPYRCAGSILRIDFRKLDGIQVSTASRVLGFKGSGNSSVAFTL